jgi:multimeric flavodoxin WrbA
MVVVKILGVVGSQRHGNTEILSKEALGADEVAGEVQTKARAP